MKASEKALELFTEYRYALSLKNAPIGAAKDGVAIQCAMIACEQAKNSECDECGKLHNPSYWDAVIDELKIMPRAV